MYHKQSGTGVVNHRSALPFNSYHTCSNIRISWEAFSHAAITMQSCSQLSSVVYSHVLFVKLTEYGEEVNEIVKISKGWNHANYTSNFTSFGCSYV